MGMGQEQEESQTLAAESDRADARARVKPRVDELLRRWQGGALDDESRQKLKAKDRMEGDRRHQRMVSTV
jgi:hypothetical protein